MGGFPCQPMSVAGKRKGTDDDRYLWPEMFRLIKQIKPQFVIGENVQGIINIQNGMVLRQVQDDLESEGFEVQCFLIPGFQASVLGTRGTESGLWMQYFPNTMDYLPPRSKEGTLKLQQGHRKGRTRPANLREQVDPETMRMYPTPTEIIKDRRTQQTCIQQEEEGSKQQLNTI